MSATSTARATFCAPCDATVAAVATDHPRWFLLHEYEPDGFTVSPDRHVCVPRDQRAGRLVQLRRERDTGPDGRGYRVTLRNAISAHGIERHDVATLADAYRVVAETRPWNNTAHRIDPIPAPEPVRVVDGVTIVGPTAFESYRLLVDGAEVVTVQHRHGEWNVCLARTLGSGRYYRNESAALGAAREMAAGFLLCSRPVACRLCRLPKRHNGPCQPWQ